VHAWDEYRCTKCGKARYSVYEIATRLSRAARDGDWEKVDLLLANGADINVALYKEDTPLYIAAENGQKDMVEWLLSKGANGNVKNTFNGFTPLHLAANNGHKDVVDLLIAKGANVNVKTYKTNGGYTPLHVAARNGHKDVVELLLSKGADVNKAAAGDKDLTPLCMAAENGHKDVVELLLASGANVHAKAYPDRTSVYLAAYGGHTDIVELLLANGAESVVVSLKSKDNWTALMSAASEGRAKSVKALIALGEDVNAKYKDGTTALMAAAENGRVDCVKALIAAGADLSAKDNYAIAAEEALKQIAKLNKLPAGKRSLSSSQACAIHYFNSEEDRDKAYHIMILLFGSCFQHIEKRNVTNRVVMYKYWVVVGNTNAYTIEMQKTLEAAGCQEHEIQYVDYSIVLADSDGCM
jgi:ankyrin repeat protein